MTFLQLLEQRHFGKLNRTWILEYANTSAEFCALWLIHSIRSNTSQYELALVLSFADRWQLALLQQLEEYLIAINSHKVMASNLTFEHDLNLVKQEHSQFSSARVILLLSHFHALSAEKVTRNNQDVDVQVTQINVPQTLLTSLTSKTEPHLQEVTLFGDSGAGSKDKSIRNNSHFPTPLPNNFLELALLERLMALAMGTAIEFAEPAVILCYKKSQYYHWHFDALYPHNNNIQQQIKQFGQREKTAIFYINDNFSGGDTEFKKPFIRIEPKQGSILTFNNCDSQGKRLPASLHRGTELISGEKWIITLWFRDKPFWLRNNFLSYN